MRVSWFLSGSYEMEPFWCSKYNMYVHKKTFYVEIHKIKYVSENFTVAYTLRHSIKLRKYIFTTAFSFSILQMYVANELHSHSYKGRLIYHFNDNVD